MHLRAPKWIRLVLLLALVLLPAGAAHAQRIPDAAIWWVGASLLAPFLAVPIKLGILRLLALDVAGSRLWMISAIEWVLWFPVGFVVLRHAGSSPPVVVLSLFASAVWLHRIRVVGAPWSCAVYLALPTPILAVALPFLAFFLHAFLEGLPVS
jgi:hypothetical protein